MAVIADDIDLPVRRFSLASAIRRNPTIALGGVLLFLLVVMAVFAPWIAHTDPLKIAPVNRLRPPSERWWFGTDQFGRDLFSRLLYGSRVSLLLGILVVLITFPIGLVLGGILAGVALAFHSLGDFNLQMPATPQRVWLAIRHAAGRQAKG